MAAAADPEVAGYEGGREEEGRGEVRRAPQRHKAPKGHRPPKGAGWKRLPDGRVAELQLLIDGRVQLKVGIARRWQRRQCWEYLTEDAARAALAAWDGHGAPG